MVVEAQGVLTCWSSSSLGRFWPVSLTITQFWGVEAISATDNPQGAFMCRSSTLTILANSGQFPGLLLTVLGPEAISMINEPWGAFTCRSSTLVVFVDSDMFHGLLLTVLVSQRDFHRCRTPRSAYV